MSTIIMEGFDNWAAYTDGAAKGWTTSGATALLTGRFAGQSMGISGGGSAWSIAKSISGLPTTLYIGAAFLVDSAIGGSGSTIAMSASSSSGSTFGIARTGTGLQTYNNFSSPTSTTISGYVQPANGTWTYLEMELTFATGTTGTVKVWQDNTLIYTSTATATGTGTGFTAVTLGSPASTASPFNNRIDDVYASTSARMGAMRVCSLYPVADSGTIGWTPNSGSNGYSRVNEAVEDGDTTYLAATGNAQSCAFTLGSLPTGLGVPAAVQVVACADGAGNTLATTAKISTTTHTSSYASLSSGYSMQAPDILDLDPTGAAWTTTSVNALVAGFVNGSP
jgi:hypothetical protein